MNPNNLRFSEAILQTIKALGGEASLKEIYEEFPRHYTLSDKQKEKWGGIPMYQHEIRDYITNRTTGLCQKGDLLRVDRGRYSLTKQGKEKTSQDEMNLGDIRHNS